MSSLMINKKTMLRWDQSINLVNLHLKGVYDHIIAHTNEISKSQKMRVLEGLSHSMNGELYNIFYYEEINSLVDHLIHTHNRPTISLLIANVNYQLKFRSKPMGKISSLTLLSISQSTLHLFLLGT